MVSRINDLGYPKWVAVVITVVITIAAVLTALFDEELLEAGGPGLLLVTTIPFGLFNIWLCVTPGQLWKNRHVEASPGEALPVDPGPTEAGSSEDPASENHATNADHK